MIRIAPLSVSKKAGVPPEVENGKWDDLVRKGLSEGMQSIEKFVDRSPGLGLTIALCIGIAFGWWIKRS